MCLDQLSKIGINYVEESGKAFKAKIKRTAKEMANYLEQINCGEELI